MPTQLKAAQNTNILLWTVQVQLAAPFLLASGMKLVKPITARRSPATLSSRAGDQATSSK